MRVLEETLFDVHDAARARTACTAIYKPLMLNDSKKISAVFSRFSGALRGGSVYESLENERMKE